jgi:putative transposase
MTKGFLYLVAVIDWYSRYVLAWQLSNSLESSFCLTALQTSLQTGKPQIFNTDQGSQFTCEAFVGYLLAQQIQVSMDGKGRASDNIFVERLWRSVKYEEVYLKAYQSGEQAYEGLENYFYFYNHLRPHQGLNYLTPAQVHFQLKEKSQLETIQNIVRV